MDLLQYPRKPWLAEGPGIKLESVPDDLEGVQAGYVCHGQAMELFQWRAVAYCISKERVGRHQVLPARMYTSAEGREAGKHEEQVWW